MKSAFFFHETAGFFHGGKSFFQQFVFPLFHAIDLHCRLKEAEPAELKSVLTLKTRTMELTLFRTGRLEGFTTGVLYLKGELLGHTLEPQWRNLSQSAKVAGQTAIPEGMYRIELAMSPHFGRKMPYLREVPGFTGVMLHWGNKVSDSKGCILVGERERFDTLRHSRVTFEKLFRRLEEASRSGETIYLSIW